MRRRRSRRWWQQRNRRGGGGSETTERGGSGSNRKGQLQQWEEAIAEVVTAEVAIVTEAARESGGGLSVNIC